MNLIAECRDQRLGRLFGPHPGEVVMANFVFFFGSALILVAHFAY